MTEDRCKYCTTLHPGVICPRIKAIEYESDGRVRRVEFYAPIDYPQYTSPFIVPVNSPQHTSPFIPSPHNVTPRPVTYT